METVGCARFFARPTRYRRNSLSFRHNLLGIKDNAKNANDR